ncbi:UDP-2,4-diacetamido-2,4,6-trideoxy-beta-L-altropyranose hydrolase [Campylobacter sp. LR286c]|uniref:UDP-2,4-diacetamido-2,4, 6-trideoxy-beta-L-altropyranose hydrolase n=1 Tax=Campylobacter sp. LR286c TaxID=2593545 RepID=UPI001237D7BA|nr:UDP-2,4-diacetamido-2,4,6-trideoxy-beta-L-altropyranose hydrolase [Campylobacter sp. LR286c]KAA6228534.1 UDP-2,4-diacetamido-2,4,6-trideoxy-beta-L-altropyranose hydrolase [Campylobacter sp. LR286c]
MKTLIRVDSSSKIGFGHIKRCLVLAKQYSEVSFACLDLEGALIEEIPYEIFILENESIFELINLIKAEKFEFLIIDNYNISANDEKLIKLETGVKILSFDDTIKEHFCDILLNVNAFAKASDYDGLVPFKCERRCGFSYALFRDEFYEEVKKKRKKIYDFFICLGGTDIKNLSIQIAQDLPQDKKIAIATSSSNAHLKGLRRFANENENISLFVNYDNIAKLMHESKKLIISASSLVNEALLLKANFKAICYVDNQLPTANWLVQKGVEVEFIQ